VVSNLRGPAMLLLQYLLSKQEAQLVSKVMTDIILAFLVKHMSEMGTQQPRSLALLSLFRLVFSSVGTVFTENEVVLRPYLATIINEAMRLAVDAPHPYNYYSMLRALFRSIGGGKFELLYKEFQPLLGELLQGLMRMYMRGPPQVKEILVELCLSVPARLSSLLQFIPLLMRAVHAALQARDEQVVKLGLRTLEFWVDNLNPDYLYPHMSDMLPELMRSLCALLRPHPSPFGHLAMSVLGKLGGRNRRFFLEDLSLDTKQSAPAGIAAKVRFQPGLDCELPLDELVSSACRVIKNQGDTGVEPDQVGPARKYAFLLLRALLAPFINTASASQLPELLKHRKPVNPTYYTEQSLEAQPSTAQLRFPDHQTPLPGDKEMVTFAVGDHVQRRLRTNAFLAASRVGACSASGPRGCSARDLRGAVDRRCRRRAGEGPRDGCGGPGGFGDAAHGAAAQPRPKDDN